MTARKEKAAGFTVLEIAVVVAIVGVICAIATPKITNAMREYRANFAMRQVVDLLNRAKTQAVSENKRSAVMIDTANKQAGMATLKYDIPTTSWVIDQIYYIPLPVGISFQRVTGIASPPGVVSTTAVTSFPSYAGSSTVFRQDFNSRGFPIVAAGTDVLSVFIGNGKTYRAITMTSVGGIRTYRTDASNTTWQDTHY